MEEGGGVGRGERAYFRNMSGRNLAVMRVGRVSTMQKEQKMKKVLLTPKLCPKGLKIFIQEKFLFLYRQQKYGSI